MLARAGATKTGAALIADALAVDRIHAAYRALSPRGVPAGPIVRDGHLALSR